MNDCPSYRPDPPKRATHFLRWYCHPDLLDEVEGDLYELFQRRVETKGLKKAKAYYWLNVLMFLHPNYIKRKKNYTTNHTAMFRNYFKIGWRNLFKYKIYSFINITGLAVGMTVAILIGLWISDELSFDSYFKHHSRLYQLMQNQTHQGTVYTNKTIATPVADALRYQYSNNFDALSLVSWSNDHVLAIGEKKLSSEGIWVEPNFPEMFTISMMYGSRESLSDPSTLLLSQSLAKALFDNENPVGNVLRLDNERDMVVGGVFEDFPANTTFSTTKLLLPWANQANFNNTVTDWSNHGCRLFALLNDKTDSELLNEKIKSLPTPHIEEWKEEIMFYPLKKLHLYGEFTNGQAVSGRIKFVRSTGVIGVFVLLLACINFMNLSTARSEKRSKEVGIRKTIGSLRRQLINQFLTESVMVAVIALVLSLLLTQLSLPFFNTLADKKIAIPWDNPMFWMLTLGFTMFSGILSGSYPAFYLSSFKPIQVLKGSFKAGRLAVVPRKVLVVLQFTVSVTLIIGTLVVLRQIQFAKDRPAGYTRSGLVSLPMTTPEMRRNNQVIRNELLQTGAAENVAVSSQSPAHFNNNTSIDWPGKDPESIIFFRNVNVSPDFGSTIGWRIEEGRDFSREFVSDSNSVVLNATAIQLMNLSDPLGETIKYNGEAYKIIGIVNDLVTQSPYDPIEPTIFFSKGFLGVITIRLNPNLSVSQALARIEPVFKKYNPESPFDFSFVDQTYERKFSTEERIGDLTSLFAMLAVFISCLGLFGLASFVAEQRTKEIGIRKVLGASVANLWQLLSKEFVVLVIISCLIAIPIAYYLLHAWLQNYEYRADMSWWIFASAGTLVLLIALLTVSFQSIKAALANPVDSLRNE